MPALRRRQRSRARRRRRRRSRSGRAGARPEPSRRAMPWIAVHLPLLSLEAFCATLPPAAAGRPVVLIDDHRVAAVDAAGARRGIRPGMKRATALALAGDVLAAQADAARDAAALLAVAHIALAFTPMV